MRATWLQIDADTIPENRGQRLRHRVSPSCIKAPHALQMPRKMAAGHEGRHEALLELRRARCAASNGVDKLAGQPLRQDEITETESWIENLAEASRVEDPAAAIEAFQCRQRAPCVVELAVIAILNHKSARFARPGQQHH